jgi:hypothetical protein
LRTLPCGPEVIVRSYPLKSITRVRPYPVR